MSLVSYTFVDVEGSPGFQSGCGLDVTYAIGKADKYRMSGHDLRRVNELILVTIVFLSLH